MATTVSRRSTFIFAVSLVVLFSSLLVLNAFRLNALSPISLAQTLLFFALSTVAFLLFITVLVLLVRNVLRLYAEQRSRVLGTRLRTRMLWGAVLVSLVPIVFMFAFSYGMMNRAVDRWFSQPVTQMRDDANRMASDLAAYTTANARVEADSIATSLPDIRLPEDSPEVLRHRASDVSQQHLEAINRILRQHETTLQGGFILVFREGQPIASYHVPPLAGSTAELKQWLPRQTRLEENPGSSAARPAQPSTTSILEVAQRTDSPILTIGPTDYALGTAGIKSGGTIVVALPLPYGLAATMARMRASADVYWTLYRGRRQLRVLYIILLAMMTSLALFACTWLALYLSRQITKPVESLADAMQAVAAGDYARRVPESPTQELGELIRSFNHMAGDLESSRAQVNRSTLQLNRVNATLEARRSELETMLETIPNGVATLDQQGRIVLANRALTEMMDPGGQSAFIGRELHEVFPAEMMEALDRLLRRSHRMGSASGEIDLGTPASGNGSSNGHHSPFHVTSATKNLLATVALLEGGSANERTHLGYVLVLEDATELLRAQKQSAWKEVARRVAHEIKNPLTPISLSAEQIHRHITRLDETLSTHQVESPSPAVIRRCSEVITSSVESMRSLVDQFAALAEFPTAQPRPSDLNTIVESSLTLFAGRLQAIRLTRRMAENLPLVLADPEAMKRALGNLIDNAAEAMQQSLLRELRIETAFLPTGMVELTIADTGAGLTDDMRERLFLPYFSTKQRGTGLGLAIAAKIIQEHQGTIRAESNTPAGAKFIVELRPASVADPSEQLSSGTTVSVPA